MWCFSSLRCKSNVLYEALGVLRICKVMWQKKKNVTLVSKSMRDVSYHFLNSEMCIKPQCSAVQTVMYWSSKLAAVCCCRDANDANGSHYNNSTSPSVMGRNVIYGRICDPGISVSQDDVVSRAVEIYSSYELMSEAGSIFFFRKSTWNSRLDP